MASILINVSSDPATGVTTTEGSEDITQTLQPPLYLDPRRLWSVTLVNASLWYSSPNITPQYKSNVLIYSVTPGHILPARSPTSVTLTTGLYTLSALNEMLNRLLATSLALPGGTEVIALSASIVQPGRISLTFKYAGLQLTFGSTNSGLATLLGIVDTYVPASESTLNQVVTGGAIASMTMGVESYVIHVDPLAGGSYLGGRSSSALASIPITVGPGSAITYSPSISPALMVPSTGSIGAIRARLTDQQGRPVYLSGEKWSFAMSLTDIGESGSEEAVDIVERLRVVMNSRTPSTGAKVGSGIRRRV